MFIGENIRCHQRCCCCCWNEFALMTSRINRQTAGPAVSGVDSVGYCVACDDVMPSIIWCIVWLVTSERVARRILYPLTWRWYWAAARRAWSMTSETARNGATFRTWDVTICRLYGTNLCDLGTVRLFCSDRFNRFNKRTRKYVVFGPTNM